MLKKTVNKFFTKWYSLSKIDHIMIKLLLDLGSCAVMIGLLYHLNSPWWGYVATLICVILQKAITD